MGFWKIELKTGVFKREGWEKNKGRQLARTKGRKPTRRKEALNGAMR